MKLSTKQAQRIGSILIGHNLLIASNTKPTQITTKQMIDHIKYMKNLKS